MTMHSRDPATEAFIRYLRQELSMLAVPIEEGCQHTGNCFGTSASEIVRTTLRSIAGYFVQMSGAMTAPTKAFWTDVLTFFESEFGASPVAADFEPTLLNSSQLSSAGSVDLRVLHAINYYDRENNTAYLSRTKMFLWRFAAAFVAADLEGTTYEEAALDVFRKVLNAETNPLQASEPSP